MRMDYEDKQIILKKGEMIIVPKGKIINHILKKKQNY